MDILLSIVSIVKSITGEIVRAFVNPGHIPVVLVEGMACKLS